MTLSIFNFYYTLVVTKSLFIPSGRGNVLYWRILHQICKHSSFSWKENKICLASHSRHSRIEPYLSCMRKPKWTNYLFLWLLLSGCSSHLQCPSPSLILQFFLSVQNLAIRCILENSQAQNSFLKAFFFNPLPEVIWTALNSHRTFSLF